jgi:hypothetical protein
MLDWTQWFQGFGHIFTGWTIGAVLIAGGAAAWFRVPVFGKYLGLAAVAVGCSLIWGAVQYDAAAGNCKEAIVRAQLTASQARVTELERQIDASAKISSDAKARADKAEVDVKKAKEDADEYERTHPDIPGKAGDCTTDNALRKRLQRP